MNEQERAEEHLRTIRRLMERATIYRAISAPTALVGGLLSLAASGVSLRRLRSEFHSRSDVQIAFISLWLLVFLLTAGANTLFIVIGARKRNEPVLSASMKAALFALAPALVAGATFTLLVASANGDGSLGVISIVWATFYGLGLLATSHFAPRSLALLGWAFFLTGIAVLAFLSLTFYLPIRGFNIDEADHFTTLFLAVTFGLYHLTYAACAWPRKGAEPEM